MKIYLVYYRQPGKHQRTACVKVTRHYKVALEAVAARCKHSVEGSFQISQFEDAETGETCFVEELEVEDEQA